MSRKLETAMNILDDSMNVGRSRHGCVATWLALMIIGNAVTAATYFILNESLLGKLPDGVATPFILMMGALSILNVIFAVMLWKYKMLGFYGFTVTGVFTLFLKFSIGSGILQAVSGLIGVAILYAILQIKDREIPAWEHLE